LILSVVEDEGMTTQTIVVGAGPEDENRISQLVDAVERLSALPAAEVVLAHVYDEDDADVVGDMLDIEPTDQSQLDRAVTHHSSIRRLRQQLSERGIDHTSRGMIGEPAAELTALARDSDAEFLVIAGRKRSPTGKAVFGSTAQDILLSAPCPVVFVRSEEV
jgi:nucleotide-binding universal stress UspA family protein